MLPEVGKSSLKEFRDPEIMAGKVTIENIRTSDNIKKWKISAITAVIISCVIIGGVVSTLYLTGHLMNQHKMEKTVFLTTRNEPTVEKIRVDTKKQTEEIEIKRNKFRVIHNFKQGLSMYRVTLRTLPVCIVTPLERQYVQNPKSMFDAMKNEEGSTVQTTDVANMSDTKMQGSDEGSITFRYSFEIKDVTNRALFPSEIQEACKDVQIFWASKDTNPSQNDLTGVETREKRQIKEAWDKLKKWVKDHVEITYKGDEIIIKIKL